MYFVLEKLEKKIIMKTIYMPVCKCGYQLEKRKLSEKLTDICCFKYRIFKFQNK